MERGKEILRKLDYKSKRSSSFYVGKDDVQSDTVSTEFNYLIPQSRKTNLNLIKPKSKKKDPEEEKEQGRITGVDQNTSAMELEAGD